MRRPWNWTTYQLDRLSHIQTVLEEQSKYKPLTLRQIYYQLVGKGIIDNTVSQYTMLSNLLKYARIDGHVPWEDIEDRVRAVHEGTGWNNKAHFVNTEIRAFLEGYRRHLVQDQEVYVEVWIEKDALSGIFSRITRPYCIDMVVCRGFSSVTFLNDFTERVEHFAEQDKRAIMLYFGDFDPSGEEMLDAMKETLEVEMGISSGVIYKKVALTRQDIFEYNLPHDPRALKRTDSRAKKHIERYGELAVELDALPPAVLEEKIHNAIGAELDFDLLARQREIEENELGELGDLKDKLGDIIDEELREGKI